MLVRLPDVVKLVETSADGYGDNAVTVVSEIAASFHQGTGNSRGSNADVIDADAHVYLDIHNPELVSRGYRIEGMYIIANPFGADDEESWYRVSRVVVGQRKLLANDVNNVHAYLRKVESLEADNVS